MTTNVRTERELPAMHPIKARRQALDPKMTARELADKLGVTETTIFRWESGRHVPSLDQMHKLCKILSCSLDELFPRAEASA